MAKVAAQPQSSVLPKTWQFDLTLQMPAFSRADNICLVFVPFSKVHTTTEQSRSPWITNFSCSCNVLDIFRYLQAASLIQLGGPLSSWSNFCFLCCNMTSLAVVVLILSIYIISSSDLYKSWDLAARGQACIWWISNVQVMFTNCSSSASSWEST